MFFFTNHLVDLDAYCAAPGRSKCDDLSVHHQDVARCHSRSYIKLLADVLTES